MSRPCTLKYKYWSVGAIQKVCHRPRGGVGSSKIVTKSDKGGRGVKPNSDVTTSKKCCFNNRIRMTLRVVVAPLYLLFNFNCLLKTKLPTIWIDRFSADTTKSTAFSQILTNHSNKPVVTTVAAMDCSWVSLTYNLFDVTFWMWQIFMINLHHRR